MSLTQQDLQSIKGIVQESVQESETRLENKITESESRLEEKLTDKLVASETRLENKLTKKIKNSENRLEKRLRAFVINELETQLSTQLESHFRIQKIVLDTQFRAINSRFDDIDRRLDNHQGNLQLLNVGMEH